MEEIASRLGDEGKPPRPVRYFVEYRLQENSKAIVETAPRPSGLLTWHRVTREGTDDLVVTYWGSEDEFRRDGEAWGGLLGAKATASQGLVGAVGTEPPPRWTRAKVLTAFLSLGALLGVFEVVTNHYDTWFASPDLAVRRVAEQIGVVEVLEGKQVELKADLINRPGVPHRDVRVSATRRADDGKATAGISVNEVVLTVSEPEIARLSSNGTHPISVQFSAKEPGNYMARVVVDSMGGKVNFFRSDPQDAVWRIKVWPRVLAGPVMAERASAGRFRLTGLVEVGETAPFGLDCELEISRVPGLEYRNVFFNDGGSKFEIWSPPATTLGHERNKFSWSTPTVKERTALRFGLFLVGSPEPDLAKLASGSKVKCISRQKELEDGK